MPFDPDAYLKSRGIKAEPPAPGQPPPTSATPSTSEPPAQDPAYDPESPEFNPSSAAIRGFGRGLGTLPLDLLRLGDYLSPHLGNLVRQIPGIRAGARGLREFVNQPGQDPSKQSWTEYLAGGAGELASGAMIPGGLVEDAAGALARKMLTRNVTKTTHPWTWVQPPGGGPMIRVRGAPVTQTTTTGAKNVRTARKVGKFAEPAVYGAAAGAVENPEHPGEGALEGALGGAAARGVGRALDTTGGHALAETAAIEAPIYALTHHFGLPYYPLIGPAFGWPSSPIGKGYRKYADKAITAGAKGLRKIPPAIAGGAVSRGVQGESQLLDIIQQIRDLLPPSNEK